MSTKVKAKKLKKRARKLKVAKVKVTKRIRINKKTGKVTVKKGLKKGAYKVIVKVKATGSGNYKPSRVKRVTFTVRAR